MQKTVSNGVYMFADCIILQMNPKKRQYGNILHTTFAGSDLGIKHSSNIIKNHQVIVTTFKVHISGKFQ